MPSWRAQTGQDRWIALHVYPGRREGYFVEVGASHGPHGEGSNSWALERDFGWNGLLIDPDPVNAAHLRGLRRAPVCAFAAYDSDGEKVELVMAGAYSGTVADLGPDLGKDAWGAMRAGKRQVTVETRRLGTILAAAGAPAVVDFLSVDTEGSELRVLRGLFPTERQFGAICVEHNFVADDRAAIRALLEANGYPLAGAHGVDDYFVHPSVAAGRDLDPARLLPPLTDRQRWVCQALEDYDRRRGPR